MVLTSQNFTPGDFFDSENNGVRLNGRQRLPLGLSLNGNLFYRHLGQELFTVSQPFFPGGTNPIADNLFKNESKGGTVQLTHDARPFDYRNVFVIGGEYQRNNLGNRLNFPGPIPTLRSTNEDVLGLFAQNTFTLMPEVVLTAGVRCAENVLSQVSPHRFTRWVKLAGGKQPTDCSAEELVAVLPGGSHR